MRASVVPGLVAIALLAGCGADEACADLVFPDASADEDALFVAGVCGSTDGDGSRDHPLASLADAARRAPAGGTILVSAGSSYAEQVIVDKPLRILAGAVGAAAETADVTVHVDGGPGIKVHSGAEGVHLRGLVIEGAQGAGVWVTEGADARLEGVLVRGARRDDQGQFGYGILADGGAKIALDRTSVDGAEGVGIHVERASAAMQGVSVSNVDGPGAIRLERAVGAVVIEDSTLQSNREVGILVASSTAEIRGTSVLSVVPGDAEIADGIVVIRRSAEDGSPLEEARADLDDVLVSDAGRVGVLFSDAATGTLRNSVVRSCGKVGGRGAGVWLQRGAGGDDGVLVTECAIHENSYVGVGLTSGARARILSNQHVGSTASGLLLEGSSYIEVGDGIDVLGGAWADIESNLVDSNARFGILLDRASPETIVKGNTLRYNGANGLLIQHPDEGIPPFSDNVLDQNGGSGPTVRGPNEPAFGVATSDFATP